VVKQLKLKKGVNTVKVNSNEVKAGVYYLKKQESTETQKVFIF
jgi:hypothetical protein